MVERQLPKLKVAGSSPVTRSNEHLGRPFGAAVVVFRKGSCQTADVGSAYAPELPLLACIEAGTRMIWNWRQRRMRLLLAVAIVACALALVRPAAAHAGYPLAAAARVALGFGETYRSADATSSSVHHGVDLSASAGDRRGLPLCSALGYTSLRAGVVQW